MSTLRLIKLILLTYILALLTCSCGSNNEVNLSGDWILLNTDLYSDEYFELQKRKHLIDSAFFEYQVKSLHHSIGPRILYTFKNDSIHILNCNSSLYYVCEMTSGLTSKHGNDSIIIHNPESGGTVNFKIKYQSQDKLVLTAKKFYDFWNSEHTLLRIPKVDTFISSRDVLSFLTTGNIYYGVYGTPISFTFENEFGSFRRRDLNIREEGASGDFLVINIDSQCYFIIEETIYQVTSLSENSMRTIKLSNQFEEISFNRTGRFHPLKKELPQ